VMFFSKPSMVNIDCFTYNPSVYELYPIDYAHKFFPNWWKALPKFRTNGSAGSPHATMKTCAGFNAFYDRGFMIPLWCDLAVASDSANRSGFQWQYSDRKSDAEIHPHEQMDGYLDPNRYFHLKLATPWLICCKENIEWSWVPNTWAFRNPSQVIIPPAVINYKYNYTSSINIFFNFDGTDGKILIENGTPMVNVIPLTERKIKIHTHQVSVQEYERIKELGTPVSFINKYLTRKRILEKKATERKCPAGGR